VDVEYVGHPLLDVVSEEIRSGAGKDFPELQGGSGKPVIALLPGSRKQEIRRMLPVMAGMASRFQGYSFVIAGAPGIEPGFYRAFPCARTLSVISGQTHRLLMHAHAALVTSGTATLETAMFGVPQVVCYKGGSLSYFIARQLVDVKYISLVNLITGREVVRELIQGGLTAKKLRRELSDILSGPGRDRVLAGYRDMMGMIGEPGAAARTASGILKAISAQGK
jgi:lipid-A-disaccharide synthase